MTNVRTYKKYYKNYKKNSYGTGLVCSKDITTI